MDLKRMHKYNKTHIFFPNTTALILCNSKGTLLKAMDIYKVNSYLKEHGKEKICIKCLNIYLKEGKNIKEINLNNFKRIVDKVKKLN